MNNYFWLVLSLVLLELIIYSIFFNLPIVDNAEPWFKHRDKLGHCVFYASLSLFLSKTHHQEIITQNPLNSSAKVSFILGFLIELGQHFFTYDRYGTFLDVLANALVILLMVVMIYFYPKHYSFNLKNLICV